MRQRIEKLHRVRWTPRAYRLGRAAREVATVVGIGVGLGSVVVLAWVLS